MILPAGEAASKRSRQEINLFAAFKKANTKRYSSKSLNQPSDTECDALLVVSWVVLFFAFHFFFSAETDAKLQTDADY